MVQRSNSKKETNSGNAFLQIFDSIMIFFLLHIKVHKIWWPLKFSFKRCLCSTLPVVTSYFALQQMFVIQYVTWVLYELRQFNQWELHLEVRVRTISISYYNNLARITIYFLRHVTCVNFINELWNLMFNVDSVR